MAHKLDFVNGLVRRLTGTEEDDQKEKGKEDEDDDRDEVRIQ